jgi:single-strand selective monofunctional uracil DNA glycosylase
MSPRRSSLTPAAPLSREVKTLIDAARELSEAVDRMEFAPPVTHVYNPLRYAWGAHRRYLERCAGPSTRVLFLGMNPGPWGMAQTGVPFGQVAAVRDWMGICETVGHPEPEHPKRIVDGFECRRSEVSGARLWGLFKDRFVTPESFFHSHFVINYCPLVFMEASARNRTPDKLLPEEIRGLQIACDDHLRVVVKTLQPEFVVGVGAFAEKCLRRVLEDSSIGTPATIVTRILHPSPASPSANKNWAAMATSQLVQAGVWHDMR